jgi:hypothetical protein
MGEPLEAVDFAYVDSDIPPGMSVREWRTQRAVRTVAARRARRARRRWRWRAVLIPWTFAGAISRRSARRGRTASSPIDHEVTA